MISLAFTNGDVDVASDTWGANCGPAALAAIVGLSLDGVRPHMVGFEAKRYTNPTMMFAALKSIKESAVIEGWRKAKSRSWPNYGLARIQWEGPWTAKGVPERVRYRHTHWVGVSGHKIFDINAMQWGGWLYVHEWAQVLVPYILECCQPEADGHWHITHSVEVARDKGPVA